jgi:hypothetical protein
MTDYFVVTGKVLLRSCPVAICRRKLPSCLWIETGHERGFICLEELHQLIMIFAEFMIQS